jgi:hypothetical protein
LDVIEMLRTTPLIVLLLFFYRVTNERALQLIRRRARPLRCTLLSFKETHRERERTKKKKKSREREALREKKARALRTLSRAVKVLSFVSASQRVDFWGKP